MTLYRLCIVLHVIAAAVWLGHMFFWSLFAGPGLKRMEDADAGRELRRLSLAHGGLGWPALAVLVLTGAYMLAAQGIGLGDLFSPALLASRFGRALDAKLILVAAMIGYQAVFGHRSAPRAIYANMLAGLLVLAASVVLAEG